MLAFVTGFRAGIFTPLRELLGEMLLDDLEETDEKDGDDDIVVPDENELVFRGGMNEEGG